jgi:hypothetical protein
VFKGYSREGRRSEGKERLRVRGGTPGCEGCARTLRHSLEPGGVCLGVRKADMERGVSWVAEGVSGKGYRSETFESG